MGVIKEELGNRGCMLSWLASKCYFWLLKTATELLFRSEIPVLLLNRRVPSVAVG